MDEKKRTELLAEIVKVENMAKQMIEATEQMKPKKKKLPKTDYCIPSENYFCRDFAWAKNEGVIERYIRWESPGVVEWMMYETKIDYCPWCGRNLED